MAAIPTQKLNLSNLNKPTLQAASTSDTYDCGPGLFAVISVGATATTITVVDPRVMDHGAAVPDITVAGVTSAEKWVPLSPGLADGSGRVTINLSQATGVTVACVDARSI